MGKLGSQEQPDSPQDTSTDRSISSELLEEAKRIPAVSLFPLVFKPEVEQGFTFLPRVIFLPTEALGTAVLEGGFDEEFIGVALTRTIDALRPHGDSRLLAESLLSRARCLRKHERWDVVLAMVLEAVSMYQRLGNPRGLGRAYIDLGSTLKDAGLFYDALSAFELAAEKLAVEEDVAGLAASFYHRGHIAGVLGLQFEALHWLDIAERTLPASAFVVDWKKRIARTRITIYTQTGNDAAASQHIENWLQSEQEGEQKAKDSFPLWIRAQLKEKRGDSQGALSDYLEAADRASRAVLECRTLRYHTSIRAQVDYIFQDALQASLKLGSSLQALSLLERSKTATAGFVQTAEGSKPKKSVLDEAAAHQQSDLGELVERTAAAIQASDSDKKRQCQEQAEWLWARTQLFTSEQPLDDQTLPAFGSLIPNVQGSIAPDTVLLEYATVKDAIWVFVVTRNTVSAKPCFLSRVELAILAKSCYYECRALTATHAITELCNGLLKPVEHEVTSASRLIIVPSADIWGVPFHAMPWCGEPLLRTREVLYGPTGSFFARSPHAHSMVPLTRESSGRVLAVPNVRYSDAGPIPGTYDELAEIKNALPLADWFVDSEATSDRLLRLPNGTRILHLACHAVFEPEYPLLSRLLLADRPVFAFEVQMANLNVDLVVLNACHTAGARVHSGGETEGMTSAFLSANCRAVVATWWPIADEVGPNLIRHFYAEMVGEKKVSPTTALRTSQIAMLQRDETSHPFYWAPFVVFGSPAGDQ